MADADEDFAHKAEDPQLSVPNANLDKSTHIKTVRAFPLSMHTTLLMLSGRHPRKPGVQEKPG